MQIISFNSYKGGACRTTTCFNTVSFLAKKLGASRHNPVLLIDMDLDSMGLTNMIQDGGNGSNRFAGGYSANSLFDDSDGRNEVIQSLSSMESEYFRRYYAACGSQFGYADNDGILFLGADIKAKPVSNEHFARIKDNSPLSLLISAFYDMEDADKPSAIIFDCAAGQQVTTQLVLGEITKSVMCMRPTSQFRLGTMYYMKYKIPELLMKMGISSTKKKIVLVPTAVSAIDKSQDAASLQKIHALRKKAFDYIDNMAAYLSDDDITRYYTLDTSLIDDCDNMGIPEIQRFKWEECSLATLSELTADEKAASARYEKLAEILSI